MHGMTQCRAFMKPLTSSVCSLSDIEKEACHAVSLLASKPKHQNAISKAGAIPGLVLLLQKQPHQLFGQSSGENRRAADSVANLAYEVSRRAADAITKLARESAETKNLIRCADPSVCQMPHRPPYAHLSTRCLVNQGSSYDVFVSSSCCFRSEGGVAPLLALLERRENKVRLLMSKGMWLSMLLSNSGCVALNDVWNLNVSRFSVQQLGH